eukprot:2650612-Rhodomonas_salina.1
MNNAAVMAIKKRLVSVSPPHFLLQVPNKSDNSLALVLSRFDSIVQKCCSFARKPLSYIQRGITPPKEVSKEKKIVFDVREFCNNDHEGSTAPELWSAMILREVWVRLMKDGDAGIRFGPKDKDFFRPLPFARSTMDVVYPGGGPESSIDLDMMHGFGIHASVSYKTSYVHDRVYNRPTCLVFEFVVDEYPLQNSLQHIKTAKIIAKRTGLPEEYCRELTIKCRTLTQNQANKCQARYTSSVDARATAYDPAKTPSPVLQVHTARTFTPPHQARAAPQTHGASAG